MDKDIVERLRETYVPYSSMRTMPVCAEAADLITSLREAARAREWVSVADRLPDEKGFYLTAEGNNLRTALFVQGSWIGPVSESNAVTHWMPLPQPPES